MFKGSNVALITPFKNNKLDVDAYIMLIHLHLKNGTNGLVPAGTTGEVPNLISSKNTKKLLNFVLKKVMARYLLLPAQDLILPKKQFHLQNMLKKSGANCSLVVTPYYNKPTQEGLYQHYKAINDACGIPIIIYNIPSRSVD